MEWILHCAANAVRLKHMGQNHPGKARLRLYGSGVHGRVYKIMCFLGGVKVAASRDAGSGSETLRGTSPRGGLTAKGCENNGLAQSS